LFTLTMAALMIPGSKLTDILGRKRCFSTAGGAPDGRGEGHDGCPVRHREVAMLSLERNLRGSAVGGTERVRGKDGHAMGGPLDGEPGS
jgi:hypothetical protein